MRRYLLGFITALIGSGVFRWLRIAAAVALGLVATSYETIQQFVDRIVGAPVMPKILIWQYVAVAFLLWLVVRLAHNEAMRYWRSGYIVFGKPYRDLSPLYQYGEEPGAYGGTRMTQSVIHQFYAVKIDIFNKPYKSDGATDIVDAWSTIEIFDFNSKLEASWRDGRWDDNEQPSYGARPMLYYPDSQNVRTLSANGRPNTLAVALKPEQDEFAYPFRGRDQILPDWRARDVKIPVGTYLLRLTIQGKGLIDPAVKVLEFENKGANGVIELRETAQRLGKRSGS